VVNLGELHRREYGRILASLIRVVRDFDLAEDVLQEAFAAAGDVVRFEKREGWIVWLRCCCVLP